MHDKNPRNVSMQEIFCKVALEIAERWSTSNNELKEPIVCGPKAIEIRLSRGWSTFSEIARDKARKATKEQWEPKRDKLLDIAFCTCRSVLCGEDDAPGTFRKRTAKENHMTVTEEPRGRYLTHFTPEPKIRKAKPAKQCAVGLVDWLKDRGIDLSLKLIGSDTTKEMSGWKGGMLHCVEELLDKRLFRSFCWLHINDLPFRHIVAKLDGPTSSDKGWCSTVGKLLSKVETLERKTEFEPNPLIEPLVDITENIASQMSTDSSSMEVSSCNIERQARS